MIEYTVKVDDYGTEQWFLNDELHRENGPAVEYTDGTKQWYLNGQLHREDGPAVEFVSGTKKWYLNGKLHRADGPAIENADGYKAWYLNGDRHREDGPAIEHPDGAKFWYLNGELHREDGPAIEDAEEGYEAWFLNGVEVSEDDVKITSKSYSPDDVIAIWGDRQIQGYSAGEVVSFNPIVPSFCFTNSDGGTVGELNFDGEDGKLEFLGDVNECTAIFFNYLCDEFNQYIEEQKKKAISEAGDSSS